MGSERPTCFVRQAFQAHSLKSSGPGVFRCGFDSLHESLNELLSLFACAVASGRSLVYSGESTASEPKAQQRTPNR